MKNFKSPITRKNNASDLAARQEIEEALAHAWAPLSNHYDQSDEDISKAFWGEPWAGITLITTKNGITLEGVYDDRVRQLSCLYFIQEKSAQVAGLLPRAYKIPSPDEGTRQLFGGEYSDALELLLEHAGTYDVLDAWRICLMRKRIANAKELAMSMAAFDAENPGMRRVG